MPTGKHRTPDAADSAILRLERAAEAERHNAAQLRKTVEELRFKIEILERGYTKQLAEARTRAERSESEAASLKQRWAAIDGDTLAALERLLATRAELAAVTAERDRWRAVATERNAERAQRGVRASVLSDSGGTINNLIAGIDKLREQTRHPADDPYVSAPSTAENAPEPMIAPELVFTKKRDGKDDSDD